MTIRPLFIAPFAEAGGSENVLLQVVRGLDPDFESRALLMRHGPLAARLEEAGARTDVEDLPGKQALLRFPAASRRVADRLRGEGISLVHANGVKAAIFGIPVARRLGVPLVWMKHDHILDGRPTRAIGALCDRVVCVTEAMAAQFGPRLRPRVSVVYPGVRLGPDSSAADTAPLVVSAGRLDPLKGFATLIRAVGVLRERGREARLAIAGPADRLHPGHREELEALVDELDLRERVEVHGFVDSLSDLYRDARVVAIASRSAKPPRPAEAAPIVVQEGMSHARPVVAPHEAGIAEIVGDAGSLVRERTPEGFAAALEPYLSDPARSAEEGARGRARVAADLTVEETLARLSALYRELA